MKKTCLAFSLAEVLVAAGIIAIVVAAAATLANSMNVQQEAAVEASVGINVQEQAVRLYRLGMDYSTITNVLPQNFVAGSPSLVTPQYQLSSNNFGATNSMGGISVETWTATLVFPVGKTDIGNVSYRTNSLTVIRPRSR